ncbi:MAG: aquaporin [Planctomycetota bacterium]
MPEAETVDYATDAPPVDPIPLPRRLAAEAVGTFLLVFFGCGSMAVDAAYGGAVGHVGIGIVWGVVVLALIYAVGDISGAHFNPAVSFAFTLAGRFKRNDALWYSGVQIIAATVAALVLALAFPFPGLQGPIGSLGEPDLGQTLPSSPQTYRYVAGQGFGEPSTDLSSSTSDFTVDNRGSGAQVRDQPWFTSARAFGFEIVLTFALVFVILCVAVGSKERGLMAGIAIGGTVGICALAAGPVCRASMNPARSIGPAIAAVDFTHLWIYVTAPFIGAALAVWAWTYIYRHPRPA